MRYPVRKVMTDLYVTLLVVALAVVLTLLLRSTLGKRERRWVELATRLGLEVLPGRYPGSPSLVGSFRGFDVKVSIPGLAGPAGDHAARLVLALRIKHRVPPGTVDRLLGLESDEVDLLFERGVLGVRGPAPADVPSVTPDPELQEAVLRFRERYSGGRLDLSDVEVRLSVPDVSASPEGLEQALRDVAELGELIDLAMADGGALVSSLERISSPSALPPESSSSGS